MNAIINQNTQLCDLLDHANELKQYKADYRHNAREFKFLPDGSMTNSPEQTGLFAAASMTPGKLTEWALKQAFEKLGKAYNLSSIGSEHMKALEQVDPALFATNMNAAVNRLDEKEGWTVRTYTDPKTNETNVRAVLSSQYLIIDNNDMLDLLNQVLTRNGTPHRIGTRSFVTSDNMSVDIMFAEVNTGLGNGNDSFERGVRIRNGEIGDWTGGVYPVIKRRSCDNSIAVDDRAMSFRFKHHGKNTLEFKRVQMHTAIGEILPFTFNVIEELVRAEEEALPNLSSVVLGMAEKYGWSESVIGAVYAGTEARQSVAGLVNGITYAAHTQQLAPETMSEMEFLGGAILFDEKRYMLAEAEAIHTSRTRREAARENRKARNEAARLARQTR